MRSRKTDDVLVNGGGPALRLVGDVEAPFDGSVPVGPALLVGSDGPPRDVVQDALGEDRAFISVDGVTVAEAEFDPDGDVQPRRDIIAPWLRSKAGVVEVVTDWVERMYQTAAFHTVRSPLYLARVCGLAPYGVARIGVWLWAYVSDPGFHENRKTVHAGGAGDVDKMTREHNKRVALRFVGVVVAVMAVLFGVWWAYTSVPLWQFVLGGVVASFGLGAAGYKRSEKQIIERTVYKGHHAPKFTESLLLTALRRAGAEPRDARPIQVIQPPVKVRSGWEAVVSVGVPASKIIKNHGDFATVLDRPANCVWLSADPEESAGWLRVVVTRKSLRRTVAPDWPLLHGGTFNYHLDEVPIGVDETGQPVTARKRHTSSVYGGIMGTGKTVSMITSLLAQLLDPRTEVHVYDLKGGVDWKPFKPILHFLRSGSDVDDHEAVLADLEDLNRRMDARFRALEGLPVELESPNINDKLASLNQYDFAPIIIVIDETQEAFELGSKKQKKRYYDLVSRLIKKGRAVSITIEAGTQEVNKQSIPIAGLCIWRMCHAVQGHVAVDQVLGTGSHGAGLLADELSAEDKGIGYFGSGKNKGIVKSYYVDPDEGDLAKVIERCRADREARNLLTGMAVGDIEPDDDYETILERVKRVWPTGVEQLQWVELVDVLHNDMPAEYPVVGDLSAGVPDELKRAADVLSGQLGRHGIKAKGVRSEFKPANNKKSGVRRGVRHVDVVNATTPEVDMNQPGDTGFDDTEHDTNDDSGHDTEHDSGHDIDDDTVTTLEMPVVGDMTGSDVALGEVT